MTEMHHFEKELSGLPGNSSGRQLPHSDAKIPLTDTLLSLIGLGPIPPSKIAKTSSMVQEGNRLAFAPADGLTSMEHVVRTPKIKAAETTLEVAAKGPLEQQIVGVKDVFARINQQTEMIEKVEKLPIVGPNGEAMPAEEAQDCHDALRDEINRVTDQEGSTEHLKSQQKGRLKEVGTVLLDFPVFLLAMMSLLNVNIRLIPTGDFYTVIMFITAVVFALFGTLLYAFIMRTMGRRHRRYKGADGGLHAEGTTARRLKLEIIVMAIIVLGAATVMASRIYLDGREAGAPAVLVASLAVLFAFLIGVSGYINYTSEYENGSNKTDRLGHFAIQLHQRSTQLHNLRAQLDALIEEAGVRIANLHRTIAKTEDHANLVVTKSAADKAIALARSYHRDNTPLPTPKFNATAFDGIKQQASELDAHHQTVKTRTGA